MFWKQIEVKLITNNLLLRLFVGHKLKYIKYMHVPLYTVQSCSLFSNKTSPKQLNNLCIHCVLQESFTYHPQSHFSTFMSYLIEKCS